MALDIGREFKLSRIVVASELFKQLSNPDNSWTVEELHRDCHALVSALEDSGFDRVLESHTKRQLERLINQLKLDDLLDRVNEGTVSSTDANEAISNHLSEMQQWYQIWKDEFDHEMDNLPVCLPENRFPGLEAWYSIEKQFNDGEYRALPLETRRSFQEAGRCFLFEQFTACAVMSMRAAEAMLREYFYRIMLAEPSDKAGWNDLLQQLPFSGKRLLRQKLEAGRDLRNELIHPRLDLVENNSINAQSYFNEAQIIVRGLMNELRKERKLLAVGICLEMTRDILPDVMVALWLLDHHGGGIGRLDLIDPNVKSFEMPNSDNYDYLLGYGSDKFYLAYGESYAQFVARELGLVDQHTLLLNYCWEWLGGGVGRETSVVYEHTLAGIIEAIWRYNALRNEKPERWCNQVFDLMDLVKRYQIDPFDSELIAKLNTDKFNQAVAYLHSVRQEEKAYKDKIEVDYLGLSGVITEIAATEFESFSQRLFDKGYQLVALTDGVQAVWIEKNEKQTSLTKFINALRQKAGTDALEFSSSKIRQKRPLRLSTKELRECVQSA